MTIFMVKGLLENETDSRFFFFFRGTLKPDVLKKTIQTAVRKVQSTGFCVKFITCD